MNDSQISVRYAKALFQSSREENKLDEMIMDIKLLDKALKTEGFRYLLESPVVTTTKKKKFISEVFKNQINELSYNFLMLVLENKREAYISGILRNVREMYKDDRGIKTAVVTVASEFDESYRKKFLDVLTKAFKAQIELEEEINPEIIGGFILKVEDEQYDASISSQLNKIKKELLQQTTSEK